MTKSNFTEIDVEGHDGSAAGLYLGGTLVTASAAEINKTADIDTAQSLVGAGAITVKNGIVLVAKTDPGAIAVTIAAPVAGTDDFKRVLVISNQAQANTVAVAAGGSFGNGGGGENLCTFSAAIGNTLHLMAYQGYWYVCGSQNATID